MVQHGPSFQNPKGVIPHFFLGCLTFQTGLLGMSRLDSVVFLPQEEGQWEEMHANPFFTAVSDKPGIKEAPGVSRPAGTLLDMPLQGAHSPPLVERGTVLIPHITRWGLPGEWHVTFSKQLIHKRGPVPRVLTGCTRTQLAVIDCLL